MAIQIEIARVKLVRESNHRYDAIASRSIHSPEDAAHIINAVLHLNEEAQEVLAVMFLNNNNCITGVTEATRGTINASMCHPREIFKAAILHNAASIMLFHNHPSGNINPSREDVATTQRIAKAGKILDIPLLDHIIIGNHQFLSFTEQGMMP